MTEYLQAQKLPLANIKIESKKKTYWYEHSSLFMAAASVTKKAKLKGMITRKAPSKKRSMRNIWPEKKINIIIRHAD